MTRFEEDRGAPIASGSRLRASDSTSASFAVDLTASMRPHQPCLYMSVPSVPNLATTKASQPKVLKPDPAISKTPFAGRAVAPSVSSVATEA